MSIDHDWPVVSREDRLALESAERTYRESRARQYVPFIAPTEPGARAKWQRNRMDKSLRDVADEAGIAHGFLSDFEHGRKDMTLQRAYALCNVLGVSLDWLMSDSQPTPSAG